MPIETLVVKAGATAMVPTGGSDLAFSQDGVSVPSGKHLSAPSVTDFRVRPNVTFKTRNPSLQPDGTYTKGKRWMSIVIPKLLASGQVVFNLARVEMEIHPESTVAEVTDLRYIASQLLGDTDTDNFVVTGSLA